MSVGVCSRCNDSGNVNEYIHDQGYCTCPVGIGLMTKNLGLLDKELAPVPLIQKTKLTCCVPECGKLADWDVRWGTGPDDYTHSCTAHVGDLLEDGKVNTLTPIVWEKP